MDLVFEPAWGRTTSDQAKAAMEFWKAHRMLPENWRKWRSEKELVALARVDGALVGVATARLEYQPPLRGRFAMYRCAVDPDFRLHAISYRLSGYARRVLEDWSREHPNEQVLGMAAVIEAREYREKQREPVWPEYGLNLNLVGYSESGMQIRVAWFDHARVE